ncbi:protein of unknown function UPF0075 [Chloroherpeton thalassium ATCC 35110]|uniref:Anhydro-N-acetylmuramic acid kinase n=1 Tax=Chloroherpeton thalassium (strain ATCC 35110 / GB-78) TaxID=517418 RepID=B3QWX2_CHLT3|nr:anhydro-N-acetylmuramic acid kinase [Chloroherpeton thalassium]ACF13336.1 protein of unknown function UPF0075 [Chloroherpeton thalassium ATCC 35110]
MLNFFPPEKKERLGIGVLSGTSVDGIDVGLVKLHGAGSQARPVLLAFQTYPIELEIRNLILTNLNPEKASLPALSQLNFLIGKIFADAVKKLIRESGFFPTEIDFVASHGQTFWHQPEPLQMAGYPICSTFQLGEGSVMANELGILTISDFRTAELSLGAEGAPLAPFLDYLLFGHSRKKRALLNIGGMSNLTAMRENCEKSDVIFFDAGPGNVLIDKAAAHFFGEPFDKNAEFSKRGKSSPPLLNKLLLENFYQKKPPKSTGRELFSDAYFQNILAFPECKTLARYDILATLTELTSEVIFRQYEAFVAPKFQINELIVSGGGAENPLIMQRLKEKFAFATVLKQDDLHASPIPAKAKEAVLFAVLGNELLSGQSASMRTSAMLGKISLPPA